MEQSIIQHHEPFDFETFFEGVRAQYIGIDSQDFTYFMQTAGIKHSYMCSAEGEDRVKVALENIMRSDDADEIIRHASSVMISIVHSPEAPEPIIMDELNYMNEFIAALPENCDVVWGVAKDFSLGNTIKLILLVNISD